MKASAARRPRRTCCPRRPTELRVRRKRLVEAIILAGGKAERLGDAAGGRPKALVDVAGTPLAGYQVARLARAGVSRVIVSCAAGQGEEFERDLAGLGAEIVIAEEQERLGRGGGIKFAAQQRRESGDVYALNGDELVDVAVAALLARHAQAGALATLTFPELASDGRLHAHRHEGLWLTVNTPKELRVAIEHVEAHPEWLA